MNMSQVLQQTGAIDAMARELNVSPQMAQTAAGALLPAIVAGLGRNQVGAGGAGSSSGGLGSVLGSVLGGGAGGGLLDSVLHSDPTPTQPGNDILGQIFGNKDVSRSVADEVAGSTGLSSDLLRKMLPILAMAVVGYMMQNRASANDGSGAGGGIMGGALGGILGQVVSGMMRR